METDFFYQIQEKPTPNRCTLLRFVATDTYPYENQSLLRN